MVVVGFFDVSRNQREITYGKTFETKLVIIYFNLFSFFISLKLKEFD